MLGLSGLAVLGGVASARNASAQPVNVNMGLSLFNVSDHGAVNDGTRLTSDAINQAIDQCHARGGGTVYVPPGIYLCGTVELKSNVTLYLEAGATLLGSKKLTDYTPSPFSQVVEKVKPDKAFANDTHDATAFHLLFARDAENIALAGPGRLDGQGPAFWVPSGKPPLPPEDAWQDVATLAWKAMPRPSPMLEFYRCKNLRIEDVQITNSAGWTLRPVECDNVFIHGITIKNAYGVNTDGLDLIGCKNVFVSDCLIDTGDDAICLKSEAPYGGDVPVSKNITITNCVLTCCCNGFKFGTASFGRFENITFSNSVIFNEDVPLKSRVISGIALEVVDGGSIEGIMVSNIRMQRVRTPLFMRIGNRHPQADGSAGIIRGVRIENVHATESILTSSITGLPKFNIEDVTLSGIRIESQENGKADWVKRKIPDHETGYPEARMFGRLPAYGLFCRQVKGLNLHEVELNAGDSEERPAIFCDNVNKLQISGLSSTPTSRDQPVIRLNQTNQACIQGSTAPPGTNAYLDVQGDQTAQIVLMNNNLIASKKMVSSGDDVPDKAITAIGNASS